MRISIGPFTYEHQSGRPYFVHGYQIEPVAWVLRAGRARVTVPQEGHASGQAWAWVHVRPTRARVTDPLGRRYTLDLTPRRRWGRLGALVLVAVLLWLWRRYMGSGRAAG
ncbi:MAG: hypothetical protein ACOYEW_09725 [Anaerolineae bacterium]